MKREMLMILYQNMQVGTNRIQYSCFADIGKSDWSITLNSNHSKAHEILANEVYNRVKTYLTTHNDINNGNKRDGVKYCNNSATIQQYPFYLNNIKCQHLLF